MRPTHSALGVLLALSGCSGDFAPYSLLDRLRILAIQSEPAQPVSGQTATLSALTFAPAGEVPALHWSWCPVTAKAGDNYVCPLDQATSAQLFATALDPSAGLPSLDLGAGATAAFTNPFSAVGLAGLCSSGLTSQLFAGDFDCDEGYPVMMVLDASTTSAQLRAAFVLRLPASSTSERNHNPLPTGLRLAGVTLGEGVTPVALVPGAAVDLQVDVPTDAPELRAIPPSEGSPGQRLERLTTSWFSSGGEIDKARTAFIDGVATLTEMASNRFTAPKLEVWPADGLLELAAVVRDDRGGEGWLVRQVRLEVAP